MNEQQLLAAYEREALHQYHAEHANAATPATSGGYALPGWLDNLANLPPAALARVVCLAFAGALWLAAMLIPAGENIHSNLDDIPYLMMGLVLWAGAQVAHWLQANIRFYWFFGVLLMLANWF